MNQTGKWLLLGSLLPCFLLPGYWLPGTTAQAAVLATIDRTHIGEDDSLLLKLSADAGEDLNSVNLSELERDFTIAHSNLSHEFSFGSGRQSFRRSSRELTLFPRRRGLLQIPSLQVGGTRTTALSVQVVASNTDLSAQQEVFVTAGLDRSTSYVQAQTIYTLTIYSAVSLNQINLTAPLPADCRREELNTQQFQREVKGRPFTVIERKYALFPEQSGTLNIPAATITASTGNARSLIAARGRQLRRSSKALTLEVLPIPASYPAAVPWLPAAALQLEEDWSQPPDTLKPGATTTRTLTLTATGLDGSQLPLPVLPSAPGLKVYADQPRHETVREASGVTGIGIGSSALLLTQPGTQLLPAIRIPWWDTGAGRLRYAELPARTLQVAATELPAADSSEPSAPFGPTDGVAGTTGEARADAAHFSRSPWFWSTLASGLGWLLTLALLLRRAPARAGPDSAVSAVPTGEARLFRALLFACKQGDAGRARHGLQAWGQLLFGSGRPRLAALGEHFNDETLQQQLQQLDRLLYAPDAPDWDGRALHTALQHWRKHYLRHYPHKADSPGATLPPLYS